MKIYTILSSKGRNVYTVRPSATLKEAVVLLSQHHIGALVVTDDAGALRGILSERDVIRVAAERADVLDLEVGEVMTREVVTGLPQDDVMSVVNTMTERRFRHLPIVDEGQLVGIISIGDVLKAQRDQYLGEIDTLEAQFMANEA
jgi:CBS domain-containing protein